MFTLFVISLSSLVFFYLDFDMILIASKEAARLHGTINDPNQLSTLLIVIIWANLCLMFTLKSKWRYLLLINLTLSFYMMLLTGSRKGFFAVILLSFLIFYFHGRISLQKKTRRSNRIFYYSLFFLLTFIVVCGVAVSPHGKRRIKHMVVTLNAEHITWGRPLHYRSTYRMFLESPILGKGFNQFRYIAYKYGSPKKGVYSHSTFLELLANTGIVALFLYLGAVFYIFYGISKSLKLNITDKDNVILRFGQILIVLMLFCNLFSGMYAHKLLWPLLAVYVGFFNSLGTGKKVES
ncbi:MAG: O-antigen ligase family protein [Desulfobacteraceae bacterium]|nr:O-antigen ligase family protein [Desulfobacteraceae bacterium]